MCASHDCQMLSFKHVLIHWLISISGFCAPVIGSETGLRKCDRIHKRVTRCRGILACLKLLMQTLAAEGDNIQVCLISDGDGEDLT